MEEKAEDLLKVLTSSATRHSNRDCVRRRNEKERAECTTDCFAS